MRIPYVGSAFRRTVGEGGFSLVEMVVSAGIMLAVMAGIFAVVSHARGTFQVQPELSDMQQRLRVVSDALSKDLAAAGSGLRTFPAVLPMRRGPMNPDGPETFKTDTITLLTIPATSAQTRTSHAMATPSADVPVLAQPTCPAITPLCGFAAGMNVVIFDDTGAYDTFTIASMDSAGLTISRASGDLSKAYDAGASVAEVSSVTHWLNAAAGQLMRYDGMASDVGEAENIVSIAFEYYGDAGGSPVKLDPAILADGPWYPDPGNLNRWDADLLRVRRIAVTVRVRSALAALKLPDEEIRFDVTPRNLGNGR